MISAKFVPLKYYTLSSQLQRLTSFSVECSGRRILSPGQIAVMRKWSISTDHTGEIVFVFMPSTNPLNSSVPQLYLVPTVTQSHTGYMTDQ